MRAEEVVWYVLLGMLVALVVFGLMSTANIVSDLKLRGLVSLMVGLIFGITLVVHKMLRVKEVAKADRSRELEEEESEESEESEEDEDGDEEEEEEEEEEEAEEEEEEEAEKSKEALEDESDEKADASDVLNTRKNPYAGYSRISAKARRKAERNMSSSGKYLEGDHKAWLDEKALVEWERLLTYDGLRKIEDSTLYAKESYKDHEFNENDEGLDQRYVDPTLLNYSPEFAAYGDESYIIDPRLLSVYAPMAF